LLPAGEEGKDLRALAGRTRQDLQPRLQRIVGTGQLQLRRSAAEEMLEEADEMAVHSLERREQPLPALAVQILDAEPQPLDRFLQILDLAAHLAEPGLELLRLLLGAQVDAAEAFALRFQLVQPRFGRDRLGHLGAGLDLGKNAELIELDLEPFRRLRRKL